MIFVFNGNGDLLNKIPEKVYQGSNRASRIYFFAPFVENAFVDVAFTLPNGELRPKRLMSRLENVTTFNGLQIDGQNVGGWVYDLPQAITLFAGEVKVQFFVTTAGEQPSTNEVIFSVEKGVPPFTYPEDNDTYKNILQTVQGIIYDFEQLRAELDENYYTKEEADAKFGESIDVQINGQSIVENGVANIPIAEQNKTGVVFAKLASGQGITMDSGALSVAPANNNALLAKSSYRQPVVPATLDYAVKVGVTTNTITLNDDEQQSAQEWLGVKKLYKHVFYVRVLNGTGANPTKAMTFVFEDINNVATNIAPSSADNEANFLTLLSFLIGRSSANWLYMSNLSGYYMENIDGVEKYYPLTYARVESAYMQVSYVKPDGSSYVRTSDFEDMVNLAEYIYEIN